MMIAQHQGSGTTIQSYLQTAKPIGRKGDGAKLFTCPICMGKGKLEVHPSRPMWYCHKCGRGGRTQSSFINRGTAAAIEWHAHDDLLERYHAISGLHRLCDRLWRKRGMDYSVGERMLPHSGPDPYRIYFPCFDLGSGIPCFFLGRLVVEGEPKYLFPAIGEARRASEVLWGLHRLRPPIEHLTIVEGCFDAVHYPNTVAILGSTISQAQCEIIRSIGAGNVTVWLDEYAVGKQAMVIEQLAMSISSPLFSISWKQIRDKPRYKKRSGELDPDLVRNPRLLRMRERVL